MGPASCWQLGAGQIEHTLGPKQGWLSCQPLLSLIWQAAKGSQPPNMPHTFPSTPRKRQPGLLPKRTS